MDTKTKELREFRKYAAFLLDHPEVLEELTDRYVIEVQQADIPLLQFFRHLSAMEFRDMSRNSIRNFLNQVLEDQAMIRAKESVDNWKADQLPGIPKNKIEIRDIVRINAIRKMLFLDFLTKYTSDISVFTTIIRELESFQNSVEEYAFQVFVDIQQEELFQEKEFIASLIDNSVYGILAFDTKLRITEWNKVLVEWNRLSKDEVLGEKIFELFPHFEHTEEGQAMLAVFNGEHVYIREKPFAGRKGYYEAHIVPLYNREGLIVGGISMVHDITHRRETESLLHEKNQELGATLEELTAAEEQLRYANFKLEEKIEERTRNLASSEEQLRLITDALPVLISYIDKEKKYRFVNQTYADLFKRSKEEIIGKEVAEIIGKKAYQNAVQYLDKALSGENTHFEARQNYGVFGIRYISANMIPHRVDQQVVGIFALGYDISDRKRIEQTLKKLYAEAKKRNKELNRINMDLDNFVYMASHDLKSPIANLEGLLTMMNTELVQKVEGKEHKVLQMMDFSIHKLKKIIEDLVDITKVQKDIEQAKPDNIFFKQIVADITIDLQPLLKESGAKILEDYSVPEIQYPASHLRSILYNLLSNALKYRSPHRKPVVSITTYKKKNKVFLSVRDNGLGMTESQQNKLFTMFKRMHTHVEGTGIGLYTIKRIIENNGGSIKVHSQVEKGTEFTVVFKDT